MRRSKHPTPDDLDRIARLRAMARSWAQIADELMRSERTLRVWVMRAGAAWAAALDRAEREYLREMGAEGLHVLRQQMYAEDLDTSRAAAVKVVAARTAADRGQAARDRAGGPPDPATMTPDQLEDLLLGVPDETAAALFPPADGSRPGTLPGGAADG